MDYYSGVIFIKENSKICDENLAEFEPGDKIYKLFCYKKVIIRGKKENFIIKVKKT